MTNGDCMWFSIQKRLNSPKKNLPFRTLQTFFSAQAAERGHDQVPRQLQGLSGKPEAISAFCGDKTG